MTGINIFALVVGSILLLIAFVWCFVAEHVIEYAFIMVIVLLGAAACVLSFPDNDDLPSPYENPEMCIDAGGDTVYDPSGFYTGCVLSKEPS